MTNKELIKLLEKEIEEEREKARKVSESIRNGEMCFPRPVMFINQTTENSKYYDYGKYNGRVEALQYIKEIIEKGEKNNDK